MKLTVLKENFVKKLSLVNHGVSTKNQLPVLLNILLVAQNGVVTLKSTDLEIGIETTISANVEKEGSVTVPAKLFLELINSLNDDKIVLELIEKNLVISTKKTETKIQTIEAEEFPKLYEEKGEKLAEIPKEHITANLQQIFFCSK